jgi:hypothetical protein|nr:MAG TPA_asm: hypothetical protein [Caudoviricetes sp.]
MLKINGPEIEASGDQREQRIDLIMLFGKYLRNFYESEEEQQAPAEAIMLVARAIATEEKPDKRVREVLEEIFGTGIGRIWESRLED